MAVTHKLNVTVTASMKLWGGAAFGWGTLVQIRFQSLSSEVMLNLLLKMFTQCFG
jgi:hypothetical protein